MLSHSLKTRGKMREDLKKYNYHPATGSPLYYSDLVMLSWTWYINRLRESSVFNHVLDVGTFNSLSHEMSCSFFMENASSLTALLNYFSVQQDCDYATIRSDFNWKPEFGGNDELQKTLDFFMTYGVRLWVIYYARTYWLARHYAYIFKQATPAQLSVKLHTKFGYKNPFTTAVEKMIVADNLLDKFSDDGQVESLPKDVLTRYQHAELRSYLYILLSNMPIWGHKNEIPLMPSDYTEDKRQSWFKPMINMGNLEHFKQYHFNDIHVYDWVTFANER